MQKTILVLFIICLFSTCGLHKGKIEKSITKIIDNCQDSVCIVKLNDVTKFVWDSVYFFPLASSSDFIESKIGTKYGNYEEFAITIIFLNKGKIVYSENKTQSIESLDENQIVIGDVMDSTKCHVYNPSNSIFKGSKKTFEGTTYYELIPEK